MNLKVQDFWREVVGERRRAIKCQFKYPTMMMMMPTGYVGKGRGGNSHFDHQSQICCSSVTIKLVLNNSFRLSFEMTEMHLEKIKPRMQTQNEYCQKWLAGWLAGCVNECRASGIQHIVFKSKQIQKINK